MTTQEMIDKVMACESVDEAPDLWAEAWEFMLDNPGFQNLPLGLALERLTMVCPDGPTQTPSLVAKLEARAKVEKEASSPVDTVDKFMSEIERGD